MIKINQFIEEIHKISKQLNDLENKFIDTYKDYLGNEFEEQHQCAAEIENLTLMLTHELNSQISFGLEDLQSLLKYISFRKTYKEYTDNELTELIDKNNELNALRKKEITKSKKEKSIDKIIADWNITFKNTGYIKLKEKLRLTIPYNNNFN